MKTVYIDVYFMINFTVDILAVFIAARAVHMKPNIRRMVLCGIIGGSFAVIELFIKNTALHILLASLFILIITLISCKDSSLTRRIKFITFFYIAAFLISGAVSFLYNLMDRYFSDLILDGYGSTNRRAIVFSLIILLIIGVLRLFIMMFSEAVEKKSTRLYIEIEGKSTEVDALIDTGNLVKDPMNMNPVIFIKRSYAENIIPRSVIELSDIDSLSTEYRRRIRLIPVTRRNGTHVMTGIRVDKILLLGGKHKEEIDATVVIDKEEGTYGGYYALAPYVTVCSDE